MDQDDADDADDGPDPGTEAAADPGAETGDGEETYQLGPDGTPVDEGLVEEPPEPETAAEHRVAGRRALGMDDHEAARHHLDRAVELAAAAGDDDLLAGALTDRANVRLEAAEGPDGDPRAAPRADETRAAVEDAVADYTAAIDHGAGPEAYFNRGLTRARLGDREASTADLERAAAAGEGHPFLVRGNAYAEASADEYARETDAARAYFNRGNANRRLGDHEAAIADYEAALDRATDLPDDGLRVLVELAGVVDGVAAATHRVRAAFLAVAGRDIWRGVDLADAALADAPDGSTIRVDAAAVVLAGDALRAAAGYGRGEDLDADVGALRASVERGDPATDVPTATAALLRATAGDDDAGTEPVDDVEAPVDDIEAPADLAAAVSDRDHPALGAAAVAELGRQLRLYR
jgi:tetratricopeptide (TPR) repeat protein